MTEAWSYNEKNSLITYIFCCLVVVFCIAVLCIGHLNAGDNVMLMLAIKCLSSALNSVGLLSRFLHFYLLYVVLLQVCWLTV